MSDFGWIVRRRRARRVGGFSRRLGWARLADGLAAVPRPA
jgi:hypothetical protein